MPEWRGLLRPGCAPDTAPCEAASTPDPEEPPGTDAPELSRGGFGGGCAVSSFHALMAVSSASFASASSQPFSASAAAASAAMAFHCRYGFVVEKIQRSSGRPE